MGKYEGKELELLQRLHTKYNAVDILQPGEEGADIDIFVAEAYPRPRSVDANFIREKIRSQGSFSSMGTTSKPSLTTNKDKDNVLMFRSKMNDLLDETFAFNPSNTKRAKASRVAAAIAMVSVE